MLRVALALRSIRGCDRRTSPSSPAAEEMGLVGSDGTLRRFGVADLRPCALARLPLTLERLFIGFPVVPEEPS